MEKQNVEISIYALQLCCLAFSFKKVASFEESHSLPYCGMQTSA